DPTPNDRGGHDGVADAHERLLRLDRAADTVTEADWERLDMVHLEPWAARGRAPPREVEHHSHHVGGYGGDECGSLGTEKDMGESGMDHRCALDAVADQLRDSSAATLDPGHTADAGGVAIGGHQEAGAQPDFHPVPTDGHADGAGFSRIDGGDPG